MLASSVLLDQTYFWPLYAGAEYILSHHWILVGAGRHAYSLSSAIDCMEVAYSNATEDRNHISIFDRMLVRLRVSVVMYLLMFRLPRVCVFSIFRLVALRHFQTEDLTGRFSIYPIILIDCSLTLWSNSGQLHDLDLDNLGA